MGDSPGSLTLELQDQPYGRCRAVLTEDDGTVLLDRVYKNRNSARASVRTRLKKDGLTVAVLSRIDPNEVSDDTEADDQLTEAPAPAPTSPADRWLAKLRLEAEKVLSEAVRLRERADQLETEHKRLTAAADVLAGPEG
jgi:hypothetical protein